MSDEEERRRRAELVAKIAKYGMIVLGVAAFCAMMVGVFT